ncbi:MAG: pyridoxal-5'-phosphate-dependent protein subunit beta [Thermoproteus sp.]
MFRCPRCGYRGLEKRCPKCGFPLIPEPPRKLEVDKSEPNIWRYSSALGVKRGISLGEGLTPLKKVGGVLVKDESKNPTGSIMDRGSAVLASTYNGDRAVLDFQEDFAISIATYLSAKGVAVDIYIDPAAAAYTDFLSLALLPSIDIRFGKAPRPDLEYGEPYFLAGIKTLAYELHEGSKRLEAVAFPLESGILALAVYEGFRDLEEWGFASPPQLLLAIHKGAPPSKIALWLAERGAKLVEVEAEEAVRAAVELARRGVYAKPLSAMAYVAASSEKGAVAVITGTGVRRPYLRRAKSLGGLQAQILELLKGREMTAYEIWNALGRRPTLRGVYKALASLSTRGLVSSTYRTLGKRKIRVYRMGP